MSPLASMSNCSQKHHLHGLLRLINVSISNSPYLHGLRYGGGGTKGRNLENIRPSHRSPVLKAGLGQAEDM